MKVIIMHPPSYYNKKEEESYLQSYELKKINIKIETMNIQIHGL